VPCQGTFDSCLTISISRQLNVGLTDTSPMHADLVVGVINLDSQRKLECLVLRGSSRFYVVDAPSTRWRKVIRPIDNVRMESEDFFHQPRFQSSALISPGQSRSV
jgi:hypothetical protein